jgi:hypothetical protein
MKSAALGVSEMSITLALVLSLQVAPAVAAQKQATALESPPTLTDADDPSGRLGPAQQSAAMSS